MPRRALMLMDFQKAICGPGGAIGGRSGASGQVAERGILDRAAEALRRARATGDLVVHVRLAFDPAGLRRVNRSDAFVAFEKRGLLADGSPDADFCEQVAPLPEELVVTKGGVSAFAGTGLEQRLLAQGVSHLLLGGVVTNFVVESTARQAADSGFEVDVIEDLCAGHSEELHRFAIERTLPLFARISRLDEIYPPG